MTQTVEPPARIDEAASLPVPATTPEEGARHRVVLMEELFRRYGENSVGSGLVRSARFWRKKYAWLIVIGGAKAIKRAIDIAGALFGLIGLLPVFMTVALMIKLTDGGQIFFWQKRVGRWGKEFPFPKFRSMVVNAEEIKRKMEQLQKLPREERERLLEQGQHKGEALDSQSRKILQAMKNEHVEGITFKMKKDPRITWIGRIIRKLSIDEMPQFWCVLKGDMSLVGPRPPVPSEVAKYTLADRRRLDVTPGLTSLWAVQGRSNIDFTKQVKLDVDYINSQSIWLDIKLLFQTIPAVLLGKGAF